MEIATIVQKTADFVCKKLLGDCSGHDWWHIQRVRQMALYIAGKEHADLFVVEIAALLHDIADWKFHNGDDTAGPGLAREWLERIQVEEEIIAHICSIIKELSFKGAGVKSEIHTIEGMCVQDADRLDAMGAIGIARVFAYSGFKQIEIHNPMIKPVMHQTFENYKNSQGTAINHFYEKLLLLRDLMNTETGRKMAEERHKFMEIFLERFARESNLSDFA